MHKSHYGAEFTCHDLCEQNQISPYVPISNVKSDSFTGFKVKHVLLCLTNINDDACDLGLKPAHLSFKNTQITLC